MYDSTGWAARAGWNLTASKMGKGADGLDLPALLDRMKSEMADAPPETRWTMNAALAAIGINFARLRKGKKRARKGVRRIFRGRAGGACGTVTYYFFGPSATTLFTYDRRGRLTRRFGWERGPMIWRINMTSAAIGRSNSTI